MYHDGSLVKFRIEIVDGFPSAKINIKRAAGDVWAFKHAHEIILGSLKLQN